MIDGPKLHDDIRLLGRAVRKRWEVSDRIKTKILERLEDVIVDGDDEIALKAIAQVRAMEGQNQKDQHAQLDEFTNRVLTIAQRCGINVDLLGVSQGAIGSAEDRDASDPGTLQG